jgi:hypothetical protein
MSSYFDLVPLSNDGQWSKDKNGMENSDNTYWKGFPNRSASGLRFETLKAGS